MFNKKSVKRVLSAVVGFLSFYATCVLADNGTGTTIGSVASNVTGTLSNVLKLLTAGSYVAGFGLVVGALFKFKQHKENPQQTQLGTCITMLIIGICLIFLPSIISVGGGTLGTTNQCNIGGFASV